MKTTSPPETPFPTLERESYFAQEWFESELERIFERYWLYAGHVSELPEVGDFFVREVGAESIVVVRADDGLHAFFNVCRHRGARICGDLHGRLSRFICPYHRWSYALDGRLLNAPAMEGVVDHCRYPLISGHVEAWNGLVFVSLAADPPKPVRAILSGADGALAPLELNRAKVAHTATYPVRANWKLVLENYFECYHCPGSHPQFCRVYDLGASPSGALGSDDDDLLAEHGSLPLRDGMSSLTMTGTTCSDRLFGTLVTERLPVSEGVTLRPTTGGLFWGDYGIVFDFQPMSPLETNMRCQWLVAGDAVEGRDYDSETLIALWDITNRQDSRLCEIAQQGIRSKRYVPGPNSHDREPGIRAFRRSYTSMMDVGSPLPDAAAGS